MVVAALLVTVTVVEVAAATAAVIVVLVLVEVVRVVAGASLLSHPCPRTHTGVE